MYQALFFEIKNDVEVMAKLVEAVPDNWSWVDGCLYAPQHLIDSGMVQQDTGFTLARFHSINPTIVGAYEEHNGKRKKPNLFAMMVEQKLPGFISYDEAGFEDNPITLKLTKTITIGFLRKGYRGDLCFYCGYYDNSKYDNPARCSLIFEPWNGPPIMGKEAGPQPARIQLEWNSRYPGTEENIVPIAAVCRSLNLKEYTPVAAAPVR
ncbi:MAG: hypothetical protein WCT08_03740 [Patescibacteria group bacterium]